MVSTHKRSLTLICGPCPLLIISLQTKTQRVRRFYCHKEETLDPPGETRRRTEENQRRRTRGEPEEDQRRNRGGEPEENQRRTRGEPEEENQRRRTRGGEPEAENQRRNQRRTRGGEQRGQQLGVYHPSCVASWEM